MICLSIPGRESDLELHYLLLDMNGTLTTDGILIPGVQEKLELLKAHLNLYMLTADTHGNGASVAEELDIEIFRVSGEAGGQDKLDFLNTLGAKNTAAIGNGYNDALMLEHAALSITILGEEGCAVHALKRADIVVKDINDALALLLKPVRVVATLRA